VTERSGEADVVVIGAGIAGASAAWALAEQHRVVLVEREEAAGLHATGRSASVLSETSGPTAVCALATASRPFLTNPPPGFCDHPLLAPRGLLWVASGSQQAELAALVTRAGRLAPRVRAISVEEAMAAVPVLRPEWLTGAVLEPDAGSIDVDALLQGYLRGFRTRGGEVRFGAPVEDVSRTADSWVVHTAGGVVRASVLVNAAGAWCDEIARHAGVEPIGLQPLNRTAFVFVPPDGVSVDRWPLVMDMGGRFYFEPEAGLLLASAADETPSEPCDARADEIDVALAVERLAEATTLEVRGVRRTWAGLRSFVTDRVPVIGFDPAAPGFFWLAAQGGYGIKTAPALAAVTAALVAGEPFPAGVAALGAAAGDLSPARLRIS
jgi:D-arginine dehydrogenase